MQHQVKILADAITHARTAHLIENHVKALNFKYGHLIIDIDNAAPLHELSGKDCDKHLEKGLQEVYGDITYELRLFKAEVSHNREKETRQFVYR